MTRCRLLVDPEKSLSEHMMKRLLIVTHHFPPSAGSGSFRMLGFARHLPKFGWNVSVVVCGPTPWEPIDEELGKQIPVETSVECVDFPLRKARSILPVALQKVRCIDLYYVWNKPAIVACRRLIKEWQPDVVLTSGPPHSVHLVGRRLHRQFGLPWVADFRDPWCSLGSDKPYIKSWSRLTKSMERSVIRGADIVVANTSNARQSLKDAYPKYARKIVAVHNGFDPSPNRDARRAVTTGPEINLLHAGALYAGRDPRPVFDALKQIINDERLHGKRVCWTLLGRSLDDRIDDDIRSRGLTDVVRLEGHVPYAEVIRRMANADILVLLDSPGRRIGVPAKLYEYIGVKRPILALAEKNGDCGQILRQSGVPNRIVPSKDVDLIRQAIFELIAMSASQSDVDQDILDCQVLTRESSAGLLAEVLSSINVGSSVASDEAGEHVFSTSCSTTLVGEK